MSLHVFVGDGKIVLTKHEDLVEEELLQKLVELFTIVFNDPVLGPQLVQKFPIQVGAIVNLLEKLRR